MTATTVTLLPEEEERALDQFSEFIRIETISGSAPVTGAYDQAAKWLQAQLTDIGIPNFILPESLPNKPIVIGSCAFVGDRPTPAPQSDVLANSHYDVVPVMLEHWTVPPFAGLRKDGRVYGRGAQDMKCVCVQYLVALAKLKELGLLRPVESEGGRALCEADARSSILWLSFVPDEEVGGRDGMGQLLVSDWWQKVVRPRIGLALDEGLASQENRYCVFYGERLPWWVRVKAVGNTGHGSRFIDGTAVSMLVAVANRALRFREEQRTLLHGGHGHAGSEACEHAVATKKRELGDVSSLNITYLRAGVESVETKSIAANVIPSEAELIMDIRISPHVEPATIKAMLDEWMAEIAAATPGLPASGGLSWEFTHNKGAMQHATTTLDDSNPWWRAFSSVFAEREERVDLEQMIFPAATDSRFLRSEGVNAIGFSPIRLSPVLLHEHDEYLDEKVFLEGCLVYVDLFKKLLSC